MAWLGDANKYPTLTLEVGFASASSGFGVWDDSASLWDDANWGPDIVWTDLSSRVCGVRLERSVAPETGQAAVGTMQVQLRNNDGELTPANTSGTYVAGGVSQIRARVPVRLRATWNGTTYDLFRGRATSWRDTFPQTGKECVTVLDVVDLWADLGNIALAAVSATGSGDAAGDRILRIANASNWSTGVDIDAGRNTMQATTYGATAAVLAQLTADSDGGLVFADGAGNLVFHDYYRRFTGSRSIAAQMTLGGAGVAFRDESVSNDDDGMANVVRYTRVDGTAQESRSAESVALNGERTLERADLICETDAQALAVADLVVLTRATPGYAVDGLTVWPVRDPSTVWPLALDAKFDDYHDVTITHPGGFTINRKVFVVGIAHDISLDQGWSVSFTYTSATPYAAFWGDAFWDAGTWDTSSWFI